jgi:hypothetical protein
VLEKINIMPGTEAVEELAKMERWRGGAGEDQHHAVYYTESVEDKAKVERWKGGAGEDQHHAGNLICGGLSRSGEVERWC